MNRQTIDKRKNLNLVIQRKILRNFDLDLVAKNAKGQKILFTYRRGNKI